MGKIKGVVGKYPVVVSLIACAVLASVYVLGGWVATGGVDSPKQKIEQTQKIYASINDGGNDINREIESSFGKEEGEVYLVIYKRSCVDCQAYSEEARSIAKSLKDKGGVVYSIEAPNSKGASEYPKVLTDKVVVPSVNTPAIVEYKWQGGGEHKLTAYRSWNIPELIQEAIDKVDRA